MKVEKKECTRCEREKLISEFPIDPRTRHITSTCRACKNEQANEIHARQYRESLEHAAKARTPWTNTDQKMFEMMVRDNYSTKRMSSILGRSTYAITYAKRKLRREQNKKK